MRVKRITPREYRAMPWKNGTGMTHEMYVYPAGSSLEKSDFMWRLSSANVTEAGPFSAFPGYDRVLFLISGRGMKITVGDETVALHSPLDSVRFRGEHAAYCELDDGPVKDFNVICQRESYTCEYRRLFSKRGMERLLLPGNTSVLFCLQGEASVEAEGTYTLNEMELLLIEEHPWGKSINLHYTEETTLLLLTMTKR